MNLLVEAMKKPNEKADDKFIEMALADIEEEIAYEESRLHIHIVGDRRDFDKARRDWKGLSKMQVAYIASIWRNAIYTRNTNK